MDNIADTCHLLVKQRWLPLRRLSLLLGYKHGTGIYGRQRSRNTKHHIPTIQIGGIQRVHYDDIIHALEHPLKEDLRNSYDGILQYIQRLEKPHKEQ